MWGYDVLLIWHIPCEPLYKAIACCIPSHHTTTLDIIQQVAQFCTLSSSHFPCTKLLHQTMKLGGQGRQMGRLNRAFREKRARFYIFRRCVVMLLRWSD
ncbi:hypothetical protein BDA96_02G170300 [Sorghum bicolor]|uniref:Uncharacterized protein n=2 Tax=Sorghum bicolor TaxID=4558 RepID=A0A921UTZ6_SORBI|nr:hypothetical protein BDA96_02G170300 [Sorghum bicolor]KXG35358.1 hypothetical protein SORBI_3002G163600 [Sorghum bicolor]